MEGPNRLVVTTREKGKNIRARFLGGDLTQLSHARLGTRGDLGLG